ncbi:hypothetical protein ACTXT7_010048 [Hymenolepis weldensis]
MSFSILLLQPEPYHLKMMKENNMIFLKKREDLIRKWIEKREDAVKLEIEFEDEKYIKSISAELSSFTDTTPILTDATSGQKFGLKDEVFFENQNFTTSSKPILIL